MRIDLRGAGHAVHDGRLKEVMIFFVQHQPRNICCRMKIEPRDVIVVDALRPDVVLSRSKRIAKRGKNIVVVARRCCPSMIRSGGGDKSSGASASAPELSTTVPMKYSETPRARAPLRSFQKSEVSCFPRV